MIIIFSNDENNEGIGLVGNEAAKQTDNLFFDHYLVKKIKRNILAE